MYAVASVPASASRSRLSPCHCTSSDLLAVSRASGARPANAASAFFSSSVIASTLRSSLSYAASAAQYPLSPCATSAVSRASVRFASSAVIAWFTRETTAPTASGRTVPGPLGPPTRFCSPLYTHVRIFCASATGPPQSLIGPVAIRAARASYILRA